jgi:transcriptional regulator with AAA-type ATPase domain
MNNGECIPIKRCSNGSQRKCVPIKELRNNVERIYLRSYDNELLKTIISDYETLYEDLYKQKIKQQDQLDIILRHITDIREKTFLSDSGLKHVEHEEKQLLDRLKEIKQSVHTIIKE